MAISKRVAGPLALLLASFLLLYRDVFVWLIDDWDLKGDYSHGWAIIPIALYLAWEQRRRLAALAPQPANAGLLIAAGSVGMLAAGTLGAETFVARVSIVTLVAGTVVFVLGWDYLRAIAFPIAFLLFMIPVPAIIENRITIPLQFVASRFGEAMLSGVGVPVLREGNLIVLPTVTLQVAEACSGMRSLMSLFTLTVLYAHFSVSRRWIQIALCVLTIPIAIFTNGLRVAGTGIAAHLYGPGAADGFFHMFSGWLVFGVAGVLLAMAHRILAWSSRTWRARHMANATAELSI